MAFELSNVEYPLPPITYDANGFATNSSLLYMDDGEPDPIKGIPLFLENAQVLGVFELNEYGKLRVKVKVTHEVSQLLKALHQEVLRVKDKLYGPSAKVSVPVWDEELNVGFPTLKKQPGVVSVDGEDRTYQEVNKLLNGTKNATWTMVVMLNVWAQAREEGTRVGYYYTLKELKRTGNLYLEGNKQSM